MGEVNEELNEAPGPLEGKQIVITGETMVPKEYFIVLLARLNCYVLVEKSVLSDLHSQVLILIRKDNIQYNHWSQIGSCKRPFFVYL